MRLLLIKDLRVLVRSRGLLGLLIVYPLLVAVLIGFSAGRGPTEPRVAVYNAVPDYAAKFLIGGRELDLRTYLKILYRDIDEAEVESRGAAIDAVRSGEAVAAIEIPRKLPQQLQAGFKQSTVIAIYNAEDPIKRRYAETTLKGIMSDVNAELSQQFARSALGYLDLVVDGGTISVGGRGTKFLGLVGTEQILRDLQPDLDSAGQRQVDDIIRTIKLARRGLGFSDDLLTAIGEPLNLQQQKLTDRGTTLSTYALAVAVGVSTLFVGVLLGAGLLALEFEQHTYARIERRLGRVRFVIGKLVGSAVGAAVVGLLLLAAFGVLINMHWERAGLWVLTVSFAALAFSAVGVALGSLARDVQAASLGAFVFGLPLAVVGLVPASALDSRVYDALSVVSAAFPFKATVSAVSAALTGGELVVNILHLFVLTVAYAAVSVPLLARR